MIPLLPWYNRVVESNSKQAETNRFYLMNTQLREEVKHLSTISNPHDRLFKGYMGDPENAKRFTKLNFPGEILEIIDLDTLRTEKDTFIPLAFRSCSTTLGIFPQLFKR